MTTQPNPYTPNLSGITVGKPAILAGLGIFLSYTISLLTAFGVPLTPEQADALQNWLNQAEIVVLPLLTYWWMKSHFHATAVDLLHTEPPATPVVVTPAPAAAEPADPPPAG